MPKLPPGLDLNMIRKVAKKLDTPELRKLYREQQLSDETFDETVEKLSEEIDYLFKHKRTPNDGKS